MNIICLAVFIFLVSIGLGLLFFRRRHSAIQYWEPSQEDIDKALTSQDPRHIWRVARAYSMHHGDNETYWKLKEREYKLTKYPEVLDELMKKEEGLHD